MSVTRERLCEDIGRVLITADKPHLDLLRLNKLPDVVVPDINVFNLCTGVCCLC